MAIAVCNVDGERGGFIWGSQGTKESSGQEQSSPYIFAYLLDAWFGHTQSALLAPAYGMPDITCTRRCTKRDPSSIHHAPLPSKAYFLALAVLNDSAVIQRYLIAVAPTSRLHSHSLPDAPLVECRRSGRIESTPTQLTASS
jgi:hypothetical protein